MKYKNQKPSFANGYIVYSKQDYPENLFVTLLDVLRISDDRLKMSWSFAFFNQC